MVKNRSWILFHKIIVKFELLYKFFNSIKNINLKSQVHTFPIDEEIKNTNAFKYSEDWGTFLIYLIPWKIIESVLYISF